jgi:hypothetical protein
LHPESESREFRVGGVRYFWEKWQNENDPKEGWWVCLAYEHPILGDISLFNMMNNDNDHRLTVKSYGNKPVDLTAGNLDCCIRDDVTAAVKQALTALYLWVKNEELSPQKVEVPA